MCLQNGTTERKFSGADASNILVFLFLIQGTRKTCIYSVRFTQIQILYNLKRNEAIVKKRMSDGFRPFLYALYNTKWTTINCNKGVRFRN